MNKILITLFGLLLPRIAFAAISYDEMLSGIEQTLPAFVDLVLVLCVVGGVYFIVRGVMMLKQFGMPLTQMSRPGELGGPLAYIVVGALLLYIPTTLDVTSSTIFGTGDTYISGAGKAGETVLGYGGEGAGVEERWEDLKRLLYKIISFIGLVSFVRGWFIIAKSGQPGVQPGTITKGTVHIIAGILCINLQGFITILQTTFGM